MIIVCFNGLITLLVQILFLKNMIQNSVVMCLCMHDLCTVYAFCRCVAIYQQIVYLAFIDNVFTTSIPVAKGGGQLAGVQLLYNLIICDYLKLLGKYFIDRSCFVMYQLYLL